MRLLAKKVLRSEYHFLLKILMIIKKTIIYPCRFLPIQNKVVLINFFGRGLGDDPKYILLELLRRKIEADIVWISNNRNEEVPKGVKVAKYKSFLAHYHWYTARVWIDNCKTTFRPAKRKEQFYLQTWHATLPLKKVEQQVEKHLTEHYVKLAKRDSSTIDLMYSNNDFHLNIFKNSFWYNGPVLKCDVPRVSPLFRNDSSIKEKVYCYFNIDREKKIILYAPTFRSDFKIDIFKWDYNRIIRAVKNRFNDEFVMLLRLHPNVALKCNDMEYGDNVINGSGYPDIQELLAASSVMINDYSASQFDFVMMHKPVFLFCPDIINYRQSDRQWTFEPEELPYKVSVTLEELESNIALFDSDSYGEKVDAFLKKIGFEDQGNGDKVIADIVIRNLNKIN